MLGGNIVVYRPAGECHEVMLIGDGGNIFVERVERGVVKNPTMAFADEMQLREFIEAMALLAYQTGVPKADESFLKGKVDAQSAHLEDMRRLAFEGRGGI